MISISLGQGDFLLPGEQRDFAHLRQIHAHRIVRPGFDSSSSATAIRRPCGRLRDRRSPPGRRPADRRRHRRHPRALSTSSTASSEWGVTSSSNSSSIESYKGTLLRLSHAGKGGEACDNGRVAVQSCRSATEVAETQGCGNEGKVSVQDTFRKSDRISQAVRRVLEAMPPAMTKRTNDEGEKKESSPAPNAQRPQATRKTVSSLFSVRLVFWTHPRVATAVLRSVPLAQTTRRLVRIQKPVPFQPTNYANQGGAKSNKFYTLFCRQAAASPLHLARNTVCIRLYRSQIASAKLPKLTFRFAKQPKYTEPRVQSTARRRGFHGLARPITQQRIARAGHLADRASRYHRQF